MKHTRPIALTLAGATLLAAAGMAEGSRDGRHKDSCLRHPASTESTPGHWFRPVEASGVFAQISNISLSANASYSQWGRPGGRVYRSMSISGQVADPTGKRVFRIASPPRVIELTDAAGRDLTELGRAQTYPDASSAGTTWMWPSSPGSWTSQSFSVNINELTRVSREIASLQIEMDIEIAADVKDVSIEPAAASEPTEIAPGLMFRVTSFNVDAAGNLRAGFEYRAEGGEGERVSIARIEVIDVNGNAVLSTDRPQEIVTRSATIGSMHNWTTSIGSNEIAEIRVRLITEIERATIRLSERDLPLLGW